MKRIIPLLILWLCLPLCVRAQQTIYTPDNLPKVHIQNKYRYLCDPAGIISPAATDSIDRMLYRLEQQTGIETVVAVVPSIGDMECFDFCHELLNSWGVGKKGKDNGLVILLVTDQRCIQFYTGYGLEGVLPDAICKRIQTQEMIPYLKDERWSEGMVAGIRATCARLDGSMENDGSTSEDGDLGTAVAIIFAFILFAIAISIAAASRKTRCPRCKKHTLKRARSAVTAAMWSSAASATDRTTTAGEAEAGEARSSSAEDLAEDSEVAEDSEAASAAEAEEAEEQVPGSK